MLSEPFPIRAREDRSTRSVPGAFECNQLCILSIFRKPLAHLERHNLVSGSVDHALRYRIATTRRAMSRRSAEAPAPAIHPEIASPRRRSTATPRRGAGPIRLPGERRRVKSTARCAASQSTSCPARGMSRPDYALKVQGITGAPAVSGLLFSNPVRRPA